MLLAMVTAKRCSSLSLLTLNEGYCEIWELSIKFQPFGQENMSYNGHVAASIAIEQFEDLDIDPVASIKITLMKLKVYKQIRRHRYRTQSHWVLVRRTNWAKCWTGQKEKII